MLESRIKLNLNFSRIEEQDQEKRIRFYVYWNKKSKCNVRLRALASKFFLFPLRRMQNIWEKSWIRKKRWHQRFTINRIKFYSIILSKGNLLHSFSVYWISSQGELRLFITYPQKVITNENWKFCILKLSTFLTIILISPIIYILFFDVSINSSFFFIKNGTPQKQIVQETSEEINNFKL